MTDTAEVGLAALSDAAAVSTGSEGTLLAAASGVEAAGAPSYAPGLNVTVNSLMSSSLHMA